MILHLTLAVCKGASYGNIDDGTHYHVISMFGQRWWLALAKVRKRNDKSYSVRTGIEGMLREVRYSRRGKHIICFQAFLSSFQC